MCHIFRLQVAQILIFKELKETTTWPLKISWNTLIRRSMLIALEQFGGNSNIEKGKELKFPNCLSFTMWPRLWHMLCVQTLIYICRQLQMSSPILFYPTLPERLLRHCTQMPTKNRNWWSANAQYSPPPITLNGSAYLDWVIKKQKRQLELLLTCFDSMYWGVK